MQKMPSIDQRKAGNEKNLSSQLSGERYENSGELNQFEKNGLEKQIMESEGLHSPNQDNLRPDQLKEARKLDDWSPEQLCQLFNYYDEFGSKWSHLEVYFKGKSQNSIKNKFYGFIKMLIRHIFKQFQNVPGKKFKALPAKEVAMIYDGMKKYRKFKGFIRKCLHEIEFKINRRGIKHFIEQNYSRIGELHDTIFEVQNPRKQETIPQKPKVSENQIVEMEQKVEPANLQITQGQFPMWNMYSSMYNYPQYQNCGMSGFYYYPQQ